MSASLLTLLLASAAAGAAMVVVAFSRHPRPWAIAYAIGASTFTPLVSAPPMLTAIVALTSLLAISTAAYRERDKIQSTNNVVIVLGVAFLLLMRIVRFNSGQSNLTDLYVLVATVAVMVAARRLTRDDMRILTLGASIVLGFHFSYAIAEVFAKAPGIWPMGDGTNSIADRVNTLAPQLAGRAMSSFAHPIPLATFALFVGTLALYQAYAERRRSYYFVAIVAVATIILAGTRSSVLAFALSAGVIIVAAARVRLLTRVFLGGLLFAVAYLVAVDSTVIESLGLGSEFQNSPSYRHRTAVLGSFPSLFKHDLERVLFGWGTDRAMIFNQGIVVGSVKGAVFFDNQFVAVMAMYGLVGLVAFVAVTVLAFVKGNPLVKGLLAGTVMMAWSFDFLQYFTPTLCWALAIGLAASKLTSGERAERLMPSAQVDQSNMTSVAQHPRRRGEPQKTGAPGYFDPPATLSIQG